MQFILNELYANLSQNLGIKKENILISQTHDPTTLPKKLLPSVMLYDQGFEFDKIGIGNVGGLKKETIEEKFNGDGKKTIFKLKKNPLKPLLSLELLPKKSQNENIEYNVDYNEGKIQFISPPSTGKNNIFLKYIAAENVAETKIIRIRLNCIVDIWSNDSSECDALTLNIIKSFFINEENFLKKNLLLKPINSINLNVDPINNKSDDATNKNDEQELYGRRLKYIIETDIKTHEKIPVIKQIEIKNKIDQI